MTYSSIPEQLAEVERKAINYSVLACGVCYFQVRERDTACRSFVNVALFVISPTDPAYYCSVLIYSPQYLQFVVLFLQLACYNTQAAFTKTSILCMSLQVSLDIYYFASIHHALSIKYHVLKDVP